MEESITIKVEDTQLVEEAVINADIIAHHELGSTSTEHTPELPCNTSANPYSEYFDTKLKPTFGYVYTIERANETLTLFQECTRSRFVCYKVQRGFGRNGKYNFLGKYKGSYCGDA